MVVLQKELQVTVEAIECCIDELKEEAQEEEDKMKRYDKETMNLKQQLQAMKDIEERLKST